MKAGFANPLDGRVGLWRHVVINQSSINHRSLIELELMISQTHENFLLHCFGVCSGLETGVGPNPAAHIFLCFYNILNLSILIGSIIFNPWVIEGRSMENNPIFIHVGQLVES